jgi:competence protein ComER
MKIGIIGTGNMGSVLISSFIESLAVQPSKMVIANRTTVKTNAIKEKYPDIKVADSPEDVIKFADTIFLCVKPLEFHPLLQHIKDQLCEQQLLVSITSPITLQQLESMVPCNVARVIPSITNRALAGASLVTFGQSCNEENRDMLMELVANISTPVIIEEDVTRVSSDIASCGPAFLSYLIQRFIESAVNETNISKEMATFLASEMIIGMGKLLEKEIYSLPGLMEKVCVKGGVTGEALKVFQAELGPLFDHVIQRTHDKYREDCEKVTEQFTEGQDQDC